MAGLRQRVRGSSRRGWLTGVLVLGLVILVAVRHVFNYMTNDALRRGFDSCLSCECDCLQLGEAQDKAFAELTQIIVPDCEKDVNYSETGREAMMRGYKILWDALRLQESKAQDADMTSQRALEEVRTMAAKFRKEIGKCVEGMVTTEYARVTVTGALKREQERSSLWEGRARELGWKDGGGSAPIL
ncbi:hypothetical protein MPTK1_4g01720 [Marchantia polymorpha subsp. ruderalis]|uniref:Uncharacterized protein n=2 Tax=Marchantia polymorpha TaxID=3197 RepID=A0AAF6B596_MARPO|nr:hypothetical protein MARPO_0098s0028 [Marchantia polymorpha]BBN07180.1 hypothetical protein Mp_4g01720 [Marchantia polymorpha subsp. ruderalis]|eukprot:PTQ32479.1 hypothetical protein MARPO_0098s0028 [Marchantia polymorpha]